MARLWWKLCLCGGLCCLVATHVQADDSGDAFRPVFKGLAVAATNGRAGLRCTKNEEKCNRIVIKDKAMRAIAKRDASFKFPWPEWRIIMKELKRIEKMSNKKNKGKAAAEPPCASLDDMAKMVCELLLEPWEQGVEDFGRKWDSLSVDRRRYEESKQLWAIRIGIIQGYMHPKEDPLRICESYRLKYNVTETSGVYNCWSFACQILFAQDPVKVAKAAAEDYSIFYTMEHFPDSNNSCEQIDNAELRDACIKKLGWGRSY